MGCTSILCSVISSSAKVFAIVLVVANILNFLPKSVTFTEFSVKPPQTVEEGLIQKTVLNNAERLFEHKIKGPEGFTILNGELYTSLHGGYIVKIQDNEIVPVVKFGESCEHWWEEDKCGRPLGLATDGKGNLIVADAYYGIWKYNPRTEEKTVLVPKNAVVGGRPAKTFNCVAVGKDGSVYWTHSSSDFDLKDGVYALLADPSGRLLKYDPGTKNNTVLMEKLHFANGVALSPDEDYLLVAETSVGRIRRIFLKGKRKWESDVFADGLPGLPDNIRSDLRKGTFLVGLIVPRDEANPVLTDYLADRVGLRKGLARLLAFLDWCAKVAHSLYPNYFAERLVHLIGHFEMLSPFFSRRSAFLELDANGRVIASYGGTDGSVTSISDVVVHRNYVYFGSPYNRFLARVNLSAFGNKFQEYVDGTR